MRLVVFIVDAMKSIRIYIQRIQIFILWLQQHKMLLHTYHTNWLLELCDTKCAYDDDGNMNRVEFQFEMFSRF